MIMYVQKSVAITLESAIDKNCYGADEDTFEEWDAKMDTSDPLNFPGYKNKLERQNNGS